VKIAIPSAIVLSLDDYPQGILALQQGKVVAVTTDESILAGQLGVLEKKSATRGKYEIPDLQISMEPYGIGMRKGDAELREVRQRHAPGDGEERRGGKKIFEIVVRPEDGKPDLARQFHDHGRQDGPGVDGGAEKRSLAGGAGLTGGKSI